MICFWKMMWATWKKPGKEPLNFNINRKKNWRVISALKDFNNCLKIVKEGLQIPNIIIEDFATFRNRLTYNLPIPQKHNLDYLDKCKCPISSFLFEPVLPKELLSEILHVLVWMINLWFILLTYQTTQMFKCCYSSCSFRDTKYIHQIRDLFIKAQNCKIMPVFKSKDDTDTNNYRPISSLSNFSRVFLENNLEQIDELCKETWTFVFLTIQLS